ARPGQLAWFEHRTSTVNHVSCATGGAWAVLAGDHAWRTLPAASLNWYSRGALQLAMAELEASSWRGTDGQPGSGVTASERLKLQLVTVTWTACWATTQPSHTRSTVKSWGPGRVPSGGQTSRSKLVRPGTAKSAMAGGVRSWTQ